MTKSIFICAGEPSGDLLGAELARALLAKNPQLILRGMGSKNLHEAGVELVIDSHDLAIMGAWEVITQLPKIFRTMKTIKADLMKHRPDCVILIDYPGFNLRLAKIAKKLGIKVFYYSCPQIWAWHYSRIKKIKKYCDHMLTLFPFEEAMYSAENMPASFVGHPLVQRIQPNISLESAYSSYNLDPQKPIIALVPGSRVSEIHNLIGIIIDAAKLIKRSLPEAQFILPVAENLQLEKLLTPELIKDLSNLSVMLIKNNRYNALQCAHAAIAVSGTVTLELALLQIPLVIIYRTSNFNYQIAKRLIRTPHFGLGNIISGKLIAKELLQNAANPNVIAHEIIELISNKKYHAAVLADLQKLKMVMGDSASAELAAEIILMP